MATGGSSIYKGSDLIHDYSCSKCEENDLNTEATYFCPQCEHYLCDKCVNLHNGYHNKHTVYGRGDIQKWAGFSLDRCDAHGDKLKVHCDDHQQLCCSVCVALNHRLCSSISHLPDLAKGFLNTAEFKQLPKEVDKMRNRLDELSNARMKDQVSMNDSYKNIISEIKAFRKKINKILDKLEKKTVGQLDRQKEDLEKIIKDDMESCVNMNNQHKTMMEKIQQINGKHKETNSYIGFRICQTKLGETKSAMLEIQKKPTRRISFKSDRSLLPFLRNLNNLGDVDSFLSMPKRADGDHVYKTQSSSCYDVKIKKDVSKCHIVGICELPSGEVVIADHYNRRVKLLNNQYKVTDHCDLPSYPQDLCRTERYDIYVAVDSWGTLHEVHSLSVTRGKLQAVRKFTTNHLCLSIAIHQGQLYVNDNNSLYQYTMDGELVKEIYKSSSPDRTICKCTVSPDGERIYVTNYAKQEFITLDKGGQVLSTLEDPELLWPWGLCVCPSGNVFVCGKASNTVLQVDRKGRKKLATVASKADGLCSPSSVCFSEHNSSLIVGNLNQDQIIVLNTFKQ
ncbi:uncharacterized protein LOC128208493 [Mya arenaria]|uniref:uncharacterized protein LOC128208493 n=1 Tax=Mya arenaria TaxID=6604 RepID=UPI0022E2B901|nr:uncharacterized protein LOC128208493 [Mya arenaria]